MTTLALPSQLDLDGDACRQAGVDPDRLALLPARLASLVEDGSLPCLDVVVERRGQRLLRWSAGWSDEERRAPLGRDARWRIYSMTKPIVSLGLLTFFEEGRFGLDDPVGTFLPALAGPRVLSGGNLDQPRTRPALAPITLRHLLTHTSGLTYDFLRESTVDALYRSRGLTTHGWSGDLASWVDALGELPLLFEPGERWNYSVSIDVVGRVVEVLAGRPLDEVLAERVLGPLGMGDTGFSLPPEEADRLVACWARMPDGELRVVDRAETSPWRTRPSMLSGGGGMVSTTEDYVRFCRMLLGRGELGGRRVLGPRTVDLALANHLPGGRTVAELGRPEFSGSSMVGVGFGLGGSVVVDPVGNGLLGPPGLWSWGGMASTAFFVHPAEELAVVAMTQLMPSATSPLRPLLRTLVYQALVD